MLLILVLGFAVFMVIQAQMGEFQESVETMNTLDWKRGQENVVIEGQPLSSITDDNELNMAVTNNGGVEARVLYVGILDNLNLNHTYVDPCILPCDTSGPIFITPGERFFNVSASGSSAFVLVNQTNVDIHLITERGNIVKAFIREGEFFGTLEGAPGGGRGTGHGFPFTLNLEMTPRFYKLPPGESRNEIYIFGANLANATMTLQNLTLRVEDYDADFDPDSFGEDPDVAVIVRTEDIDGNVVESCTNVPLSKSSVGIFTTYVLEFPSGSCTISTLDPDLTLYVQIDGYQAEADSKYALLRLYVEGTVNLGGPDIQITTNVAAITIQG